MGAPDLVTEKTVRTLAKVLTNLAILGSRMKKIPDRCQIFNTIRIESNRLKLGSKGLFDDSSEINTLDLIVEKTTAFAKQYEQLAKDSATEVKNTEELEEEEN